MRNEAHIPHAEQAVPLPRRALNAVEKAGTFDRPAAALARWLRRAARGATGQVLRGRWLGHPLHPLAVTLPIGAWLCSVLFDLVPGGQPPARRLVAMGLLAAPPAMLLGLVDYADLDERQRRVGLVHATCNALAIAIFGASYVARARDATVQGRFLGALGLAVTGVGGALGGHLSYAQGAGVLRWQDPGTEATR